MSVNLEPSNSAPDLINPVIGFRGWTYSEPHGYLPAEWKIQGKKQYSEFVPPREYVTLPDGKVVLNMKAVGEAWEKWRDSIYGDGKKVIVRHARGASEGGLSSRAGFEWSLDNTAECSKGKSHVESHVAPEHDCQCGLYCYYEPQASYSYAVNGIVTCSGKIEAHQTGMRAQHMRIEHIFGGPNIKPIAERFGVPWSDVTVMGVESRKSLMTELASEYGDPLPVSMRPKVTDTSAVDIIKRRNRKRSSLHTPRWGNRQEAAYRYLQNAVREDNLNRNKLEQAEYEKKLIHHERLLNDLAKRSEKTMRNMLGDVDWRG